MTNGHTGGALTHMNGSDDRLDELERDIATTRISLGRTIDELADRLLPQSAERLVNVSFDAAGGSFGENAVVRCLEFMRSHPIPTAVIGCTTIAALLITPDESEIDVPRLTADPLASGPAAQPQTGVGGAMKRYPTLLAALGMTIGAVAAILLASSRKKTMSAQVNDLAPRAANGVEAVPPDLVITPT